MYDIKNCSDILKYCSKSQTNLILIKLIFIINDSIAQLGLGLGKVKKKKISPLTFIKMNVTMTVSSIYHRFWSI